MKEESYRTGRTYVLFTTLRGRLASPSDAGAHTLLGNTNILRMVRTYY
jgi:hypothetical protein